MVSLTWHPSQQSGPYISEKKSCGVRIPSFHPFLLLFIFLLLFSFFSYLFVLLFATGERQRVRSRQASVRWLAEWSGVEAAVGERATGGAERTVASGWSRRRRRWTHLLRLFVAIRPLRSTAPAARSPVAAGALLRQLSRARPSTPANRRRPLQLSLTAVAGDGRENQELRGDNAHLHLPNCIPPPPRPKSPSCRSQPLRLCVCPLTLVATIANAIEKSGATSWWDDGRRRAVTMTVPIEGVVVASPFIGAPAEPSPQVAMPSSFCISLHCCFLRNFNKVDVKILCYSLAYTYSRITLFKAMFSS